MLKNTRYYDPINDFRRAVARRLMRLVFGNHGQPTAEPLTRTLGRCCSRAIRRTTARVTRKRDDRIFRHLARPHGSSATGAPARLITASMRASEAI